MAVNFGSAIAQGLVKGLGEGYSKHLEDQRRERLDAKRLNDSFKMFKKQTQFRMGMENVQKQNEALGSWETAAKMSTGDLAYQVATKASEPFSKEDRPKFFRETMKNLNGMSKAELLARAGYVKPDYSQYIDNPDYQDAIPRSRLAGIADMPDMEQTFKYDPTQYAEKQKEEGEKVSAKLQEYYDDLDGIKNISVMKYGAPVSQAVARHIRKYRPDGKTLELKGAETVNYDERQIDALIDNGQVVNVGGELKFVGELDDGEREALGMAPEAPMETPEVTGSTGGYVEPTTQAYIDEQEQKAREKELKQAAKDVEKSHGKAVKSYKDLEDLYSELQGLDEETKDALFGGLSLEGVIGSTDWSRKLADKFGNEAAKKARKFLARMTNVSAALKHEQYGSAQTKTEMANFADQLGDPSLFQSPETLAEQIKTRMDLVGNDLDSSVGMDAREAYLSQHPELAESSLGQRWVPKEAEGDTGENGQVSDSSAQLRKEAEAYVDELIASGQYDESQREGIINHLINTATQSIE